MATLLYEELGIPATATTEESTKAYKKKALQTHPDRLPPTASAEQKKEADEKFRKVNHAYEVLTDAEKRKEYDLHGIWPPPQDDFHMPSGSGPQSHFNFNNGYPDPFFSHHHHGFQTFAFTDPFTLFDSIFGDFRAQRSNSSGFSSGSGFHQDPFQRFETLERELDREFGFMGGFGSNPFASPFSVMGGFGGLPLMPPMASNFGMLPEPPRHASSARDGRRWVSESFMTQSINGVAQTIQTRRDSEGNEHVTRTFPDGRQVHTINGIQQSSRDVLPTTEENKKISAPRQPPPIEPKRLPPRSSASPPPFYPPPPYDNRPRSRDFPSSPQEHRARGAYDTAPPPHNPTTRSQSYSSQDPSRQFSSFSQGYAAHGTPHTLHNPTTAAQPVVSHRDKGGMRSRDSYNLHPHREQHQTHLHGTHHKSQNPRHPNLSPYYLDDDKDHSKHYHGRYRR